MIEKLYGVLFLTALLISVAALVGTAGCDNRADEISAEPGEQVELKPGQTVIIESEELKLTFVEVTADSRCPTGATCVWEGEVSLTLQITYQSESYNETLIQPGLTSEMSHDFFKEYIIEYNVLPYPELEKNIEPGEYRLQLIIKPAPSLSGGILVTFDVEGEEYRIFVKNEDTIEDILALQRGESEAAIPSGKIIGEPVFYNQPWSWHIDPVDVHMAEFTIEVCSGLPSHVENDIDYWVNTVGRFCPWSAEIVEIEDYR
jgi:hypothetical protein